MNLLIFTKDKVKKFINSTLFKTSGIYTITSIINAAIPFFLIPILTRYLTPEDYGIVSMFTMLISFIGVFTGLSIHGAINVVYFDSENFEFKEYIFNCIIILLCSTLLVFIICLIFLKFLSNVTKVPEKWVLFAVLISFFQFLTLALLSIYQVRMKAINYSLIQIIQAILNLVLSILFVVILLKGWVGRLLANLLSVTLIGLFALFLLLTKWSKYKININYIKHALNFGIPLIPHTIGGMLMVLSSRFIITNALGLRETGLYTAGMQIGSLIGIINDSFVKAWAPWLYERLKENKFETKIKIVKFTYFYFFTILTIALIFGYFSPFIVKIVFGKKYYDAKDVILWSSIGYAFNGMYYMVAGYIFYVYKTYYLTIITFICGILNIPITYIFIKYNNFIGASQSYAIVLFLSFILTWILASKVYKMPWLLKGEKGEN